jgi:tetrapyrrole methylase family protein/MazG family protein
MPRSAVSRRFEDLVALQQKLLSPDGCPWDRQQTHESLRTYLLEEAYEVLDALDSNQPAKLAEELGDLLLQIVFHAQLARTAGEFEIGDVIESIYQKMVRRHPHVFGEARAENAAQVLKNWEQIKAEEREKQRQSLGAGDGATGPAGAAVPPASLLDGVPKTLPALLEAYQLTRRAARVGFDWELIEGVLDKLAEEAAELREAMSQASAARQEEEVGDLLFAAANVARFLGVDPELALRKASRKFTARFQAMEQEATRSGRLIAGSTPQQLDALWEQVKKKS